MQAKTVLSIMFVHKFGPLDIRCAVCFRLRTGLTPKLAFDLRIIKDSRSPAVLLTSTCTPLHKVSALALEEQKSQATQGSLAPCRALEMRRTYQPACRALCTRRNVKERLPSALMNPFRQDHKGPQRQALHYCGDDCALAFLKSENDPGCHTQDVLQGADYTGVRKAWIRQ